MTKIGTVVIRPSNKSTITSQNFKPKPNVSLSEINDVQVSGVENGDTLVYNSTTGKFEASPVTLSTVTIVTGGTF